MAQTWHKFDMALAALQKLTIFHVVWGCPKKSVGLTYRRSLVSHFFFNLPI